VDIVHYRGDFGWRKPQLYNVQLENMWFAKRRPTDFFLGRRHEAISRFEYKRTRINNYP
jgi:hypothetical protein